MNIKNRINLIRSILYMQDVVRNGTITHTAEQNGIKAPNLSKLLTELEETLGCKLLNRSSRGIIPTPEGLKIYNLTLELENGLNYLENICKEKLINPQELRLYIADGLEIPILCDFRSADPELRLIKVTGREDADVAVLNYKPEKAGENYTRLKIGSGLQQNIWLSVNENHPASMEFYDFIIGKLLS